MKSLTFILCFVFIHVNLSGQSSIKGKLFIIGGGKRSVALNQAMLHAAQLGAKDYIAVLPMASSEPDSAYYYVKKSLEGLCKNTVAYLNFTKDNCQDKTLLDSLKRAKLIFISGGDQNRFMQVVLHTPVYTVIHQAYERGATIAGTSAGAAVMSREMITGNELLGDTTYHENLRKLWKNNLEVKEGLGLISNAIIDQHFIVRSRYNRLLSALAMFPHLPCIGIDESTAVIVQGNTMSVVGDSQVVVLRNPEALSVTKNGLIKVKDIQFSIYTSGDKFSLK